MIFSEHPLKPAPACLPVVAEGEATHSKHTAVLFPDEQHCTRMQNILTSPGEQHTDSTTFSAEFGEVMLLELQVALYLCLPHPIRPAVVAQNVAHFETPHP